MRKLIGLLVCCLSISSCSLSTNAYQKRDLSEGRDEARLFTVSIIQWGDLQFSGLLALQHRQDGLYYVVIDATGIKLIEAVVSLSGDHRLIHAVGSLKTSQLPNYLSTSLRRIYLLEPLQSPCSQELLLSFCRERLKEHGWRKYVESGPFTVWEVCKSGMRSENEDSVVYSQPWLGVRIILEEK